MKEYCLITTNFCTNCSEPSKEHLKSKFNYDGPIEDIFVNFSNEFSPYETQKIPFVGNTKRRDLVYGKIFLLKQFIEKNIIGKYEYLCHVDYSDTKFKRSFTEMMEEIKTKKIDFIISTEKNAWPYFENIQTWVDYPLPQNEFNFLNSGGVISKTDIFYNLLIELERICLETPLDFWDDQGVWQYYDLKVKPLNKDHKSEYFFSTALLDESYYTMNEQEIKTKFDTYPYLIHDNSSFSLNLINRF